MIPTAAAGSGAGYTAADRNAAVEHMAKLGSPFEAVMGTTRVADFAMVARRHMYEYGTTSEQLAEVAVAQRHSATLHPRAVMRDRGELTVERGAGVAHDGRAAPSPRLLSREPGRRLRRRHPTRACRRGRVCTRRSCCSGGARVTATSTRTRAPELTSFSGRLAADTAFGLAGVTRDDIDVAGVSDHFTISVITELEDAGFCAKGEGGAVRRRRRHRARRSAAHQHPRRLPLGHARGELRAVHAHRAGRAAPRRGRAAPGRRRRARVPLRRRRRVAGALRSRARESVRWPTRGSGPTSRRSTRRSGTRCAATSSSCSSATTCGQLRFVPSERCRNCGSPSATWTPVSGDATVYTFSIVHRAPTPAYQADAPVRDRVRRARGRTAHADAPGRRRARRGRDRHAARGRVRRRRRRPHPVPLPPTTGDP